MISDLTKFNNNLTTFFNVYTAGVSKAFQIQQSFVQNSSETLQKHFKSLAAAKDVNVVYDLNLKAFDNLNNQAIKAYNTHLDHIKSFSTELNKVAVAKSSTK